LRLLGRAKAAGVSASVGSNKYAAWGDEPTLKHDEQRALREICSNAALYR
jgi:hypothetical protein